MNKTFADNRLLNSELSTLKKSMINSNEPLSPQLKIKKSKMLPRTKQTSPTHGNILKQVEVPHMKSLDFKTDESECTWNLKNPVHELSFDQKQSHSMSNSQKSIEFQDQMVFSKSPDINVVNMLNK